MSVSDPKSAPRSGDTSLNDGADTTLKSADISRRGVLAAGLASVTTWLAAFPPAAAAANFLENRRAARGRRRNLPTAEKELAILDYRASLSAYGGRLSDPSQRLISGHPAGLPYDFDVLILGSGYGGAVCAARLAQSKAPGTRIALLERGREWVPGTFPDTFRGIMGENRLGMLGRRKGRVLRPTGMVNFFQGEEINVITGSGLGGTSLINANVVVRPDWEVFHDSRWPMALRDRHVWDAYFARAAAELGVQTCGLDSTPKMAAQRNAIERLQRQGTPAHYQPMGLAVTLDGTRLGLDGRNRQGMIQRPCTQCGDCMAGCNVGAKNILSMNYIPLAKHYGAEIFTGVEAQTVTRRGDHYAVELTPYTSDPALPPRMTVTGRIVIVAAGSLGSTELMLKSRERGLPLSAALGEHWSGNGDSLGFIVDTDRLANSAGFGAYPTMQPPVGPSIQSGSRIFHDTAWRSRVLIQDGNMPRAYANVIGTLMRDVTMERVMVLFGMGHDGSRGRIVLKNGGAVVEWPGAKSSAYRAYVRKQFTQLAQAHGGRYRYLRAFGDHLITVHPLGGCGMADDPRDGVVNDRGEVFDVDPGHGGRESAEGVAATHSGLYIADGSVIPHSLGANPLFTISALAERIAEGIVLDPRNADLFHGVSS